MNVRKRVAVGLTTLTLMATACSSSSGGDDVEDNRPRSKDSLRDTPPALLLASVEFRYLRPCNVFFDLPFAS